MPLSDRTFDKKVEQFLIDHPGEKYLDLGVGAGKYGKMIKSIKPEAYVVGVEADADYIEKYGTREIYDELHNIRIEDFTRQNLSFTADVIILGDVLEHLFKSDGIDLINFLVYRCKAMVIVFPSKFVMFDFKGHLTEAHNSVWTESDFLPFEYTFEKEKIMNFVTVKGYWSDSETVYNLNNE